MSYTPRSDGKASGRSGWSTIVLSLLVAAFLILKSFGFGATATDENIYFYFAAQMARGALPYRDFFFAHPPMHLVPGWLLTVLIGGFDLTFMKSLPVVGATITGVCVFHLARRGGGGIAGVVAAAMFFFSYDVLRASSHWTGINWSVAWLATCTVAAFHGKGLIAGLLAGIAVCTGVYAVPTAVVLAIVLAASRPKQAIAYSISAFGVWAGVSVVCLAFAGKPFAEQVYLYHLAKPPSAGLRFVDRLDSLLFHNFFLVLAPLYSLPILITTWLRSRGSESPGDYESPRLSSTEKSFGKSLAICTIVWMANMAFLASLQRVYDFYFMLTFPFAAVCAGLYVRRLYDLWKTSLSIPKPRGMAVCGSMTAVLFIGFAVYPMIERRLDYFDTYVGHTKRYGFPDSSLPLVMQDAIKRCIWTPERSIGTRYTGIQYYLWHENRGFETATAIAKVIRENAGADDTIFGDSTSTPLIALLAGRQILNDFADTNAMRFRCQMPSIEAAILQLEAATERHDGRLTWLVVRPGKGIALYGNWEKFALDRFVATQVFESSSDGAYILMKRKEQLTTPVPQARAELKSGADPN